MILKAGKITIEIPAGKTREEVEKIFEEVISMICEDLHKQASDDVLKDYKWPMNTEAARESF